VDEVMQLAGVAALTLPPTLLGPLSDTQQPEAELADRSMFKQEGKIEEMERKSFVDDEAGFREAFAKTDVGKGEVKTTQVCMQCYRGYLFVYLVTC
jgi:transaldolase